MKINDKNLSAFATSSAAIDREGYLSKRGDVNKSFQKRWFVLKGNLLFYFEKKLDKEPIGVIILEGCTVELAEEDVVYSFKIMFHGAGNRTYVLAADSQESLEGWMRALSAASYDYMKLMVAELQRQLDELIETEKAQQVQSVAPPSASNQDSQPPVAPPRHRRNPFNDATDSVSQSSRVGLSRWKKLKFRELHDLYGRQIRRDFDDYKSRHKENESLITLY